MNPSRLRSISKSSLFILLLTILISSYPTNCYLQFKLNRIPTQTKSLKSSHFQCPSTDVSKTLSQADYKQVCYQKDISYSFQLYKDGQIYYINADFTTPISWIKGKQCTIAEHQGKRCSFIFSQSMGEKIKDYTSSIKKKLKKHKNDDQQDPRQKAQIQGSSNVIKGYLEKPAHLAFQVMDSNRLTRLVDILMLGFFVLGEKDALQLQSTQFINATVLTKQLNAISDGAISLRFDQNSQNSFLNEIFAYTKAEEKIATLYLGENSYLALGELSLKFSEYGYSGISWVKVQQDQNFGKIPTMTQMLVQDTQHEISKKIQVNKPAVLTISASYIGIHSDLLQKLRTKFSKLASCGFEQHGYLKCTYTRKSDKDKDLLKRLTFVFGQSAISLDFKELVLHQQSKSLVFNIRQVFQQDYLILGEPVFQKYTLYFDYAQQRIGFTLKRQHFQKPFINVVSLIRFLVMVFTVGCCFILCSAPCRMICTHLWKRKVQISNKVHGRQGLRLKQYSPIQQNPYDEISQKIQSITTSRDTTQVDGHPDDSI